MSKKKILIVDDNVRFTYLLKLNLEQTGLYEVRTENYATKALASAREFHPDLILLDLLMPDIEGPAIWSQIKADEHLKDTPVMFLTAAVRRDETESFWGTLDAPMFIAKPVRVNELLDHIEDNLKKAPLKNE